MATIQKVSFAHHFYAWLKTTRQIILENFKISAIRQKLKSILIFPHYMYKSVEILSCHSNQSIYATARKNNCFVEANAMNSSAKFQLFPQYSFWGVDWIFFANSAFSCHDNQSNWEVRTKIICLLKDHSINICQNICNEIAINANFHFSHYKSMETWSCHSNEST